MSQDEIWSPILDFPGYLVSNFGRVGNEKTGRILRESRTGFGIIKVGIMFDGKQYTRSVALLVAQTFIEGQSYICNTPMHLDCDPSNNHINNLVWRPKHFAWKYKQQFSRTMFAGNYQSIMDIDTNVCYPTMIDAAMINGLLIQDIWRSITRGYGAPPTGQKFIFIRPN